MQPRNDCVCNQSRYFSESSFVFCFFFVCVTFVLSCHLLLRSVCRRETLESSGTLDSAYFVHGDMYEVVLRFVLFFLFLFFLSLFYQ